MLAPYSIVFTAHSSLQKHAMHTNKCVYGDNDSTLNLVHTKMLVWGTPLELVGNYTIIGGDSTLS